MSERQEFLKHIEANPRDYSVRKIFADWLEELGTEVGDDDLDKLQREWSDAHEEARERMIQRAKETGTSYGEWVVPGEVDPITGVINVRDEGYESLGEHRTYDELMQAAHEFLDNGGADATMYNGRDHPYWYDNDIDSFWADFTLLTGRDTNRLGHKHFMRCGC